MGATREPAASARLGADPAATDPARVLRPAGAFSFKHGEPRPVVCTRLELDAFTLAQVVGHLPDDPRYLAPPTRATADLRRMDFSTVLQGLLRTVSDAPVGNRNNALFWAACRVRERADAGDINDGEAREALRQAALTASLAECEAERTLESALDAQRKAA
ncbi:MAG: hypothetical protein M3065_21830 [Actinomycetota bacterium]|nr:hypothetical protein [Actinomycetota bacterium]